MKKLCGWFSLLVASLLIGGCRHYQTQHEPRLPTVAELQQIKAGMSTNEVAALLGEPRAVDSYGKQVWWEYKVYPTPATGAMKGTTIDGAHLVITNGHVASFRYAYGMTVNRTPIFHSGLPSLVDRRSETNAHLDVFIVFNERVAYRRLIDSKEFPEGGSVALKPDFQVFRIKKLAIYDVKDAEALSWNFDILLYQSDAARLKQFTESNLSKKILFGVSGKPAQIVKIVAPIETGSFILQSRDSNTVEWLKQELTRMLPAQLKKP